MREPEYEDISVYLSAAQRVTPELVSRRAILKMLASGIAITAVPHWLLDRAGVEGMTAAPSGALSSVFPNIAPSPAVVPTDGVLVIVQLGGGNDGLNTVVPISDGKYHDLRGGLAIKESEALHIAGGMALHPSLANMKKMFDAGKVAIVQGVGHDNSDLSHFQSMEVWMAGWAASAAAHSGWVGRYTDGLDVNNLNSVTIGQGVPLHFLGKKSLATSLPTDDGGLFGYSKPTDEPDKVDDLLLATVRELGVAGTGRGERTDSVANATTRSMDIGKRIGSCYPDKSTERGELADNLKLCANVINADLGVRVLGVEMGSFDTHSGQSWQHKSLLEDLDKGVDEFFKSLDPKIAPKVTLMTFSEFGRRAQTNGEGTDHGTAAPLFVIGDSVKGGLVGEQPSLADLDDSGNLKPSTTFYQVYATMLSKWLGGDEKEILGKGFDALPLFRG